MSSIQTADGQKLNRTIQCAKCPWKVNTNPFDIPNGYCEVKHQNLKSTIAQPGSIQLIELPLQVMACHHSTDSRPQMCIGWLHNQLGAGNNIPLRISARKYSNLKDIKVKGPQHERFEDTLPSNK
jgi:Family of unknown function (DUF6283)